MKTKSIIIFAYALLVLVGGVIGYLVAGSFASLISGLLSGSILFVCSYFVMKNHLRAYDVTLVVLCFLLTFFCYRLVLTHKFAPSGVLFLLTTLLLIYLGRTRPVNLDPK